MVYNEDLAERVRAELGDPGAFSEIKMFGGLAFMVNTHMACGVVTDGLMIRVGKAAYDDALGRGAAPMTMGERTMAGMVLVTHAQVDSDQALATWVQEASRFAQSEPPKPTKKRT